jgi:hypothetical protein
MVPLLPLALANAIEPLPDGTIRLGTAILDATTARAVLVRLAEAVGDVERVGDWPGVRERLDALFRGSVPVSVREVGTGIKGRGLFVQRSATRGDLRLGDFTTAAMVLHGRRFGGFVVGWRPCSLAGMVPEMTQRRVSMAVPAGLVVRGAP